MLCAMDYLKTVLVCRSTYCRTQLVVPTYNLSHELACYHCHCGYNGLPDLYPEKSEDLPDVPSCSIARRSPSRLLDPVRQRDLLISLLDAALL